MMNSEIKAGDKFIRNGSGAVVEVTKVYNKTMDIKLESGRIVEKQKIKVFLLSYTAAR